MFSINSDIIIRFTFTANDSLRWMFNWRINTYAKVYYKIVDLGKKTIRRR